MKKRWIFVTLLVLLCALFAGCKANEQLELYVLPQAKVSDNMSATALAALAKEQGRKVLTGKDFSGVDWENQRFALLPQASTSVSVVDEQFGGCSLLKSTGEDVFVWVLGKRALYLGGFRKGSGTLGEQRQPYIVDDERYIFSIEGEGGKNDPRFNKKLYAYFSKAGLLKSEL